MVPPIQLPHYFPPAPGALTSLLTQPASPPSRRLSSLNRVQCPLGSAPGPASCWRKSPASHRTVCGSFYTSPIPAKFAPRQAGSLRCLSFSNRQHWHPSLRSRSLWRAAPHFSTSNRYPARILPTPSASPPIQGQQSQQGAGTWPCPPPPPSPLPQELRTLSAPLVLRFVCLSVSPSWPPVWCVQQCLSTRVICLQPRSLPLSPSPSPMHQPPATQTPDPLLPPSSVPTPPAPSRLHAELCSTSTSRLPFSLHPFQAAFPEAALDSLAKPRGSLASQGHRPSPRHAHSGFPPTSTIPISAHLPPLS